MTAPAKPRQLSIAEATREALVEEMERDPSVFIMGEDVSAGTPFKVLSGMVEQFGADRVLDTPISEAGFTGIAVGAAMTGLRPVVDIMYGDFITLAMDQLVNQAAKIHYMSGGKLSVPLVVRTTLGAGRRSAAQHSQSLHSWLCHVPGLKVALPATPQDTKGIFKSAIRDESPVVIFQDKAEFAVKGEVADEEPTPLGLADIRREGTDVTVIATSSMVSVALAAAEILQQDDISVEVVDPRTLVPLDSATLIASVRKTSRAVVVDEGHRAFGITGEIASVISEGAFYDLDAPVLRLAAMDVPIPFSPSLEDLTIPDVGRIVDAVRRLCGRRPGGE